MQNQEIKLYNGLLLFKPNKKSSNYGFVIKHEKAQFKISFELQLTFLGIKNQNFANYKIDRKPIFINNQPPETIVYEIANKMTNAIYPLEFTINQNLECVSINNHDEVMKRCQIAQNQMANYYTGKIPEKMTATFKENYTSQTNLIKQLQNDLAFRLLFFPFYKAYNHLLQAKTDYTFKIQDETIHFELKHQLEKTYNENEKLLVHTESNNDNDSNSFKATFELYPNKNTLATANGKIVYLSNKEIEMLHFECYHLNP